MSKMRSWKIVGTLALLCSTGLTGCQTWPWESGMTLPSGHYLQHQPQYIPRTPPFPFSRELALMEEQNAAANVARPVLPQPVAR